jgi:aldose 1-epimerase
VITASSRIGQSAFGRTGDGQDITRFTLVSVGGMRLEVLDYGAIVQGLYVPDRHGRAIDVVLGYDDLSSYERDGLYTGVAVGRYANRIRGATFVLDGRRYHLSANEGPHHLHGGIRGFGKVVWRARPFENAETVGVMLKYTSRDGEEGYPGNLDVQITYAISGSNVLSVEYRATSDSATPVNLTQHSYFNLSGEGSGDVLGHELMIHADSFTEIDASLLPTGVLASVAGTPLDFRITKPIGAHIGANHEQLRVAGGYDHNFVLNRTSAVLSPAARVSDPASELVLDVFTTEPGMQFYSANFPDAVRVGKRGHSYGRHGGFSLEMQHFPDSPNQPGFPSTILRPGDELRSRTEFRFSAQP